MSDLSHRPTEAAGVSFTPEQLAACLRGDNPVALVEIRGSLDVERLRRALTDVAAGHDILRIAVTTVSGFRDPRQWFGGPPADVTWTTMDLSAEADPGAAASADMRFHTQAAFDVEGGALLRAVLYRLAAAQWRLARIAAPLVCDGGGLAILCRDLRDAYGGRLTPDFEGRAGYAVYAEWCREAAGDADAAEGRDYWQDHLGEAATPLHLPYRHPEAASGERVDVVRRAIDSELAVRLNDVATRCGRADVATETVLQAAWWALLAHIADSDDVLVGWRHDCRPDYAPFARTLGVFEKVLPLRLRIDAAMRFGDLLTTLADTVDEHRAWQEHAAVVLPGQDGHPAIGFSVTASGDAGTGRAGEAAAWGFVLPLQPCGFEMLLLAELDEEGAPVAVAVQVDPNRYDMTAARVLLEQFFTVIAALPEALDLSVADLPFVGAAERERLLLANAPPSEPGDGLPLGDVIALWAEKTPAAPALAGAEATLSYAELEAAVMRLAAWLVAQGVGREEVVALDVTRSVGMVVALLAIWRAGGCYLPLDPQWPYARRRQLLQESAPRLVLSEDPAALRVEGIPTYHLASVSAPVNSLPVPPVAAGRAKSRLSDAAYVLFTSGSTGKPKGLVVDHGQMLSYVEAESAVCGLYERRRFALTSTVA
ncbi:MAG: condensation domain-containing protein, partial [Kiloniellaceae bacterium]